MQHKKTFLPSFQKIAILIFIISIFFSCQNQDMESAPCPYNYLENTNFEKYKAANEELGELKLGETRVVFMGNSITEVWPISRPDFFKNSKYTYIGRGISGQTTPQMLLRFQKDVINLQPKVVTILAGINDIAQNTGFTPIELIAENIKSMADLARAHDIEVILCSVLPAADFPWRPGLEPVNKVIELNNILEQYAAAHNIIYVDYHSAMKDENNGLKVPEYTTADDLVHPNEAGYAVMEGLIQPAIDKALAASARSEENGWISLFDGTSTKGWRAYNKKSLPPQWVIKDGVLTFDSGLKESGAEHEGGQDIIYAAEEFDNFELYLEWKIPKGGNSGIFYHVKEGYGGPPEVAPEYQLIDDENYAAMHDLKDYNISVGFTDSPSSLQPLQQTACDYAMTPADPAQKILHPAGEWNTTRIVFTPQKVEHWLNGKKVLSFVPWSEEWYAKKNSGKWECCPDYGKFKTGYIGLQDHDSPLWFRNIKIRRL